MLISPASVLPAGEHWRFEVKWDGMRALVSVGPAVRVHSRHGHDHTGAFPEMATLGSLASRSKVVLDGELVCLDPATGRPSFERLMARVQSRLPVLSARKDPPPSWLSTCWLSTEKMCAPARGANAGNSYTSFTS